MKEKTMTTKKDLRNDQEPEVELTRVSLNLNDKSIDNVNYISAVLGEKNKTRVVSIALMLTRAILEHRAKGDRIIFRDNENNETQMQFIIS